MILWQALFYNNTITSFATDSAQQYTITSLVGSVDNGLPASPDDVSDIPIQLQTISPVTTADDPAAESFAPYVRVNVEIRDKIW